MYFSVVPTVNELLEGRNRKYGDYKTSICLSGVWVQSIQFWVNGTSVSWCILSQTQQFKKWTTDHGAQNHIMDDTTSSGLWPPWTLPHYSYTQGEKRSPPVQHNAASAFTGQMWVAYLYGGIVLEQVEEAPACGREAEWGLSLPIIHSSALPQPTEWLEALECDCSPNQQLYFSASGLLFALLIHSLISH